MTITAIAGTSLRAYRFEIFSDPKICFVIVVATKGLGFLFLNFNFKTSRI
jgi:hypothetical protein